jgi:molybdenum cofactor guanylyltransferase
MLTVPRMLLIGSSGRNSGKTTFACDLLRRFGRTEPITAIKVTVIRERDGTCPRGGEGCGVCASLEGEYAITEETDLHGQKDTSRLLAAGAQQVFWLRVMAEHMEAGLSALLQLIDRDMPLVCESNSLRLAVEPGLFLMVRDATSDTFKASARDVAGYADRTVDSDGHRFDVDLDAIHFTAGRWLLREQATAVVLAGGNSRRMGQDKSLIDIQGRPMIERVCDQLRGHLDDILVSANDPAKYAFLDLTVVPDRLAGMGPMMGLASSLEAASHDLVLVVACDLPDINLPLAHRMLALARNYEVVVPRIRSTSADRASPLLEPLFAVYRRSIAPTLFDLLESGERRIRSVFDHVRTCYVDVDDTTAPINLNTEEEYRSYVQHAHTPV